MRRLAIVALASVLGVACTTVRQLRDPSSLEANGKATRTRTDDALDYSIAVYIEAPVDVVWGMLTDAPSYLSWNSTLLVLKGPIVLEGEVELVSKVAPDRTFNLTVSALEAPRHMVWEDGGGMFLGVRHFTLTPRGTGTVLAMSETYSGFFLSSAEAEMPDFRANFEAFAEDARREAERRAAAGAPEAPSNR